MQQRTVLWTAVVAVASVLCWQAAQSAPRDDQDAELYRLFVDALEHVDKSYVKKVDRRELVESAITGMLDHLDPYSNYIPPTEWKKFDQQTRGEFGGIGVQISLNEKDGYLTVISPLAGTPAYEAGILAGDRILEVNGEKLDNVALNNVVEKLTGPAGSEIRIKLQHKPYDDKNPPFEVTLKRAMINIESVLGDEHAPDNTWDYMLDKQNKIAYVRLNSFNQNTADVLREVLDKLVADGMRGLILDLRFNPGGLLTSAVDVSDMFLREGVIVSTKGRNTVDKKYTAKRDDTLSDFPMVVLVNRYSASASEIVSACLQDHKRAVVVGERSWGKGSVQNVIEMEDGKSALKLTTAGYMRPNGHNIHRYKDSTEKDEWGVKPNEGFEVSLSTEEMKAYAEWRRDRDLIIGKKDTHSSVAPPAVENKPAAEAPPQQDQENTAKKAAAKETHVANEADNASKPPKTTKEAKETGPFVDKQLAKALEYLQGELKKNVATKN